ncbi:ATP synthase subunit I [Cyanobium usitatum]|uniref:ATP synthase subunit I n=1 Tax=Cyanobium usitatum TaxID=2304190 RepID=UPI002AD1D534|nr:ATP synthase subunit I [Cyanobium usitatum]
MSVSLPCPLLPDSEPTVSTAVQAGEAVEQPDDATGASTLPALTADVSNGMDGYFRLQRRLLLATLLLSAVAVAGTAVLGSISTASSLLVGALAGLLYLWLLSRSVTKLGENARRVSKVQLLVPVVLVLIAARIPQLSILPALLGFLLYKPAVILQAVFDT